MAAKILDELLSYPEWLKKDARQLPFEAILESYPRQQELTEIILKLYGKTVRANYLHQCLADGLRSGKLEGIITTNYDLAMEAHLPVSEVSTICTKSEYEEWKSNARNRAFYFKIHGSAEAFHAETLVCTLAREGILLDWKQQFLSHVLKGRCLVVIGYSGKDFELCPYIAKLDLASVYWLQLPNQDGTVDLTPNAKRVVGNRGTVITGNILDSIPLLFGKTPKPLDRLEESVQIKSLFDTRSFEEWRLRLLDRLSCASLGLQLARSLAIADQHLEPLYGRMLGHAGKYLQAARHWSMLSRLAGLTSVEGVQYAIEAATAWFIYGSRKKSQALLQSAEDALAALPFAMENEQDVRSRMQGNILRLRLTWLRREAQYTWRSSKLQSTRRSALPIYKDAVACLQRGSLDDLAMLQDNAEIIGIPLDDRLLGASESGYESLGLKGLSVVRRRNAIEVLRRRLTLGEVKTILAARRDARRYGWHHEAWKWSWIFLRRIRPFDIKAWREFLAHFRSTEYPLGSRLFRLFWLRPHRTATAILAHPHRPNL